MKINLSDKQSVFRLAPFLALGILIFSFNPNPDMPYFLRGYITLMEVQVGCLAVFFATRKFIKLGKNRNHS
jgi:hypothetical protein